MHRLLLMMVASTVLIATLSTTALPAAACAGLIGSNGAVNLGRTTTLAAYHDGVEHYVTAFKFLGGGGQFGTLIPLPGIPTSVERGGGWTLQRLQLETDPPQLAARSALPSSAVAEGDVRVVLQTRVDALDLTVLEGGSRGVAAWATDHGFRLSPDAPEVLEFYARRSPIFLAAIFDADAATERGQAVGDGTPIQITIPTANPWVPLRILGLGKQTTDRVEADVYLLTDRLPAMLPNPTGGLALTHSAPARKQLLDDLRSDENMGWIPQDGWLTKLKIDTAAGNLAFDLAVDASGRGEPSRLAAGLEVAQETVPSPASLPLAPLAAALFGLPFVLAAHRRWGR